MTIEEAFKNDGYIPIPFLFNGAGHPTVVFKYKESDVTFLLDTGAGENLLDTQFAKDIGLDLVATGTKGGGAGGLIHDTYSIGEIAFRYNDLVFSFEQFYAMDFDTIWQALETQGTEANLQGILGFSFFEMTKSYIDYVNRRIYVKTK
jgi:hypothetical protein